MKEDGKDFCFNSRVWNELNLKNIILKKVKRQSEKRLSEALNNIRVDKTTADDLRVFYEREVPFDYEPSKDILQIFGRNKEADAYNAKCFNEIPEKPYTYEAKDELYCYNDAGECSIVNLPNAQGKSINQNDIKLLEKFNKDCNNYIRKRYF